MCAEESKMLTGSYISHYLYLVVFTSEYSNNHLNISQWKKEVKSQKIKIFTQNRSTVWEIQWEQVDAYSDSISVGFNG